MIPRVLPALVEEAEDRGGVVAQGGGKALIPLSLEGTEVGQTKAAQALAKITITSNPEMAFPGERIYEVVRPLVSLLHLQRTGLQNFEGLMALTNLAGISERLRQKILKERAVPMIEGYMFEEHELIRLAATECMCNMAMSKEVQELFLAEGSDRLKLMVLYSGEEDEKLRRAASGTLAMLTALHPPICKRIPQVTVHWLEILQALLLSPSAELQHRGAVVVMNMMAAARRWPSSSSPARCWRSSPCLPRTRTSRGWPRRPRRAWHTQWLMASSSPTLGTPEGPRGSHTRSTRCRGRCAHAVLRAALAGSDCTRSWLSTARGRGHAAPAGARPVPRGEGEDRACRCLCHRLP